MVRTMSRGGFCWGGSSFASGILTRRLAGRLWTASSSSTPSWSSQNVSPSGCLRGKTSSGGSAWGSAGALAARHGEKLEEATTGADGVCRSPQSPQTQSTEATNKPILIEAVLLSEPLLVLPSVICGSHCHILTMAPCRRGHGSLHVPSAGQGCVFVTTAFPRSSPGPGHMVGAQWMFTE